MAVKNLLRLYSMIICCVSAIMLMVTFSMVLVNVSHMVFIKHKYRSELRSFSSADNFIASKPAKERAALGLLSEKELDTKIQSQKKLFIQKKQDRSIEHIIDNACWLVTAFLFWMAHIVIYKRATSKKS